MQLAVAAIVGQQLLTACRACQPLCPDVPAAGCTPCKMQGKPAVRKAMVVTPSSLTQARLLTLLVLSDVAAAASSAVPAM